MPPMPCMNQRRRHRRRHHRRMPTFGKHHGSVTGAPLHSTLTRFATGHGLWRSHTLDKCLSPAGLHPNAASVRDHLHDLYDRLKGGDELLSRAKFENFLLDVQKDQKKPSWAFSDSATFGFEQFEQLWWAEYSAAKRPIHPDDKDLDKPISNYFINSSHNTYIEDGNQITGEAKALQYKKVLESGCRCVEIDVWNGTEADEGVQDTVSKKPKSVASRDKGGKHWSFLSMFTWMKQQTQHATRSMSFPANLKSKKSQASFRARPLARAPAIAEMMDSESTIESLLAREPRVCHAHEIPGGDVTLHKPIPFRTVCQTIRESAFSHGNDLPVIISLEVHANRPQQEKMVQIMKDEWGSLLLDEHLPNCDPLTKQPTLRDLRRKILIKVRTGTQVLHPVAESHNLETASTVHGSEPSDCGSSHLDTLNTKSSATGEVPCRPKEIHRRPTIEALRRLAIYTYSPGHFASFAPEDDARQPAHIFSFGEETLKGLHRTQHRELFEHNRGFLARTFPDGLRSVFSSNPNYPTLFWRKGVQMVALNWQVWDTAMELNDAMFDHEQGWVLKPPGYRSGGGGASCQADVAGQKLDLTITVLAGQHVPTQNVREEMKGTARVNVFGVKADDFRPRVTCFLHVESAAERNPRKKISKDETARRTRVARTEQPNWGAGGSRLQFPTARHVVEEVSFVRFHVDHCRQGWPDRTAWACVRLDRLQEGYRLIKLRTDDGYRSDGVLLVKIEKRLEVEQSKISSLRARTWNVCKGQLRSSWSCV